MSTPKKTFHLYYSYNFVMLLRKCVKFFFLIHETAGWQILLKLGDVPFGIIPESCCLMAASRNSLQVNWCGKNAQVLAVPSRYDVTTLFRGMGGR